MYLKCKRKYRKVFLFKIQPGNEIDINKDASVIESYLNVKRNKQRCIDVEPLGT